MQKKAIRSAREDGRILYYLELSRKCYVEGEVDALVSRLFEGDRKKIIGIPIGLSQINSAQDADAEAQGGDAPPPL
jgi:predicted transcriptional regulator